MRFFQHWPLRTQKIIATVVVAFLNALLLWQFFPTRWPYLWPSPALPIILGGILVLVWLRQQGYWNKTLAIRVAGAVLLFLSEAYAWHTLTIAWAHPTLVAILQAVTVLWVSGVIALGVLNQLWPRDNQVAPPLPAALPEVAVVIPTYGEPVAVLEPVLKSLLALDYPRAKLQIYISDDGHRAEVLHLAARYHVHYHLGAQRDAKAGNLNSCLPLIHELQPACDLILTQDADEVIDPAFLQKLVGYFVNPAIAFVQTPKECLVPKGDPFGNRDRIFYDTVQTGRNGAGAAFACGSGVVWRISALERVGGFNTWNVVEDMTTSYELHSLGYRSDYHNEILSVGLAPDDIPGLIKQRGTWAVDTWRMFLFNNPLTKRGHLSVRQRLHYLELGLFYFTSAFVFPLTFLVPVLSLISGDFLAVEGSVLFPWIVANALYYVVLAGGSLAYAWRHWQYWIGHAPVYQQAFWIAVRSRRHKPGYKVTRKTRVAGFYGHLLWPQFAALGVGIAAAIAGLLQFGDRFPVHVVTNIAIIGYYSLLLSGICRAAFYGVGLRELPVIGLLLRWARPALPVSPQD
ncbi:MAG TPA: glycosyltransferase [Chloroflexia bacterium]|jgi:cellulose synthase (UDP-forming)|nr:glycosyltransferase [Chloroflexia bacterium]